ncbi:unnamed protein product [Brachionus calyciflorus]|uniref:Uncharacterized protein n=1 Tax=Brachionus calyciflorus TaxID=104777 RepID=A0A814JSK6_9BILA|nr:unnamed protein product [Brachionus calyciflorus]
MIIEENEDESDYDDPDYDNLVFDSDEEIKILKKAKKEIKTNHKSNDLTDPIVSTYKSKGSANGRYIYKGSNNGLYYLTENFNPGYPGTKRAKFCVNLFS